MTAPIQQLLDLERLDNNLFRSRYHRENFRKTLFGGQVLSQALMAAYLTREKGLPHSLHAYFLRAGSSEAPVIYDVENVRDGRSLASRHTVARQFGRPIFNLSASFHIEEPGYHHAEFMPSGVPLPEDILAHRKKTNAPSGVPIGTREPDQSASPFEMVPIEEDLFVSREIRAPDAIYWMKASERLPDEPIFHMCALAFASDIGLLASALLPHDATIFDSTIFAASIDHAMWFHSSNFRADEWVLCKSHSPWAGGARGFSIAHIYTRDGQLIASTAQEGLIRPIAG